MSWIEALILGLVQGLTEFLPVSSSGHLVIAKALFGVETKSIAFELLVHAATVLSVIVVFWSQILDLLKGLFQFKYNTQTRYILMICISMIPVFIVGIFFKDYVEDLFGSGLITVGIALLVTAILLFFSEKIGNKRTNPVTFKSAFAMGLAQAIAVIPGLSRSGSTIATGLMCGVDKKEVTQFSFLMVLVPILGEAFLELIGGGLAADQSGLSAAAMICGFASAFVSGLFACKVMIALVRKARLKWFALYCAVAGLLCLILL